MIESGPVSGLVGSQRLGERIGSANIIAADMGGTTFKVGVVREGLIEYQRESMVLRYHYALPKMDVVSLGLAGGSIISIDERTGTPRIGPRSAGSYPGPVCYGHGGDEPTITDVDAILGYLNPDFFLGGRESLDIERARAVFEEKVAAPLGRPMIEAAAAMYRLANSLLLRPAAQDDGAARPRPAPLRRSSRSAARPACTSRAYAEELGVARIVDPPLGLGPRRVRPRHAPTSRTRTRSTHPLRVPVDVRGGSTTIFAELESRVAGQLAEEGFEPDDAVGIERSIDMRYRRQVHILTVPVEHDGPLDEAAMERTLALFERLYQEKYGRESAYREAGIELVAFRLRGLRDRPQAGARGAVARRPGRSRYARDERARVGRRDRPARGSAGVQLRATAPGQPARRPGDRVDADHDPRRRARLRGPDGLIPQPGAREPGEQLKLGPTSVDVSGKLSRTPRPTRRWLWRGSGRRPGRRAD